MTLEPQDIRRRRTRYAILICLILIPVLTYLETVVFEIGEVSFPISGNVLVFSLININIILLLLMVFLVLRNLLRLIFEQRKFVLGKSLRIRLVISFISLSLIPTILLFFIALQFVSTSMDYWFNSNVDASLDESLRVAQDIYQGKKEQTVTIGNTVAEKLIAEQVLQLDADAIQSLLEDQLTLRNLDGLTLLSEQRQVVADTASENINYLSLPEIPVELFRLILDGETEKTSIQPVPTGEIIRSLTPVYFNEGPEAMHIFW